MPIDKTKIKNKAINVRIYTIPGDNTYEYSAINGKWVAREKGSDVWNIPMGEEAITRIDKEAKPTGVEVVNANEDGTYTAPRNKGMTVEEHNKSQIQPVQEELDINNFIYEDGTKGGTPYGSHTYFKKEQDRAEVEGGLEQAPSRNINPYGTIEEQSTPDINSTLNKDWQGLTAYEQYKQDYGKEYDSKNRLEKLGYFKPTNEKRMRAGFENDRGYDEQQLMDETFGGLADEKIKANKDANLQSYTDNYEKYYNKQPSEKNIAQYYETQPYIKNKIAEDIASDAGIKYETSKRKRRLFNKSKKI